LSCIIIHVFLNGFEAETGRSTDAGFILASIYFMDMARDHYKRWRSPRELQQVKEHPYYYLFEQMRENCVSRKQFRDHQLLMNHPVLYRLKYHAIGVVEFAARVALAIKPLRKLREQRKYPLNEIPR